MYNLLPKYLSPIASNIKETKNKIQIELKCKCGCNTFKLYKNKETPEEYKIRKNWENLLKKYNGGGYSDQEGNIYLTSKNFCGMQKKIKIDPSLIPKYTNIIKAKCSNCGNEFVIFNNIENGYNANTDINIAKEKKEKVNFEQMLYKNLPIENNVKIVINNRLTYEDITKEFENATKEFYSNAFSCISIYILDNKKYKCIYSEDTL